MEEAFGKRVASPWDELRGGLALGNAEFQKRVDLLLSRKAGQEEVKWVARAERGNRRRVAAGALAARLPERRWQVWARVRLGGERRIDVARGYGYKDGSAITQILKRLQKEAKSKPVLAERMARLEIEINEIVSSVKS
jgi:hypothetical protein